MRRTYPSTFWKYTTHLLRCCAQINPQRIKDTPAVNLCSRLVSVSSISKGLRNVCFTICRCCEKINPQRIKTAKDGSGVIQERDLCYAQISSLSSCTRMYNCLTVYFKRLTESMFYGYAASENTQRIKTDTNVQLLNRLFRKALETGKRLTESFFKTVG